MPNPEDQQSLEQMEQASANEPDTPVGQGGQDCPLAKQAEAKKKPPISVRIKEAPEARVTLMPSDEAPEKLVLHAVDEYPGGGEFQWQPTKAGIVDVDSLNSKDITLTPKGVGTLVIGLVYKQGGKQASDQIQVTVNGIPKIEVAEAKDFGKLLVGKTSEAQTLEVKNTGTGPLKIEQVTITGDHEASFVNQTGEVKDFVLAPGKSLQLEVAFKPEGETERKNAILAVLSDATNRQMWPVDLTGTAVAPLIEVTYKGGEFTGLDFPYLFLEDALKKAWGEAEKIVVKNTGNDTLTIEQLAGGGDFAIEGGDLKGIKLDPGAEKEVSIRFQPGAVGDKAGALKVKSDARNSPELDFPLKGQCVEQAAPEIKIDAPKIVIVKRDYHGQPEPGVKVHRVPIKLRATAPFDGKGELTCSPEDVKIFETEDSADALAYPVVVESGDLGGKTLYMEAVKPSSDVEKTELKFELKDGSVPPKPAVTEKITCVKLQLDVYKARPEDGSEPAIISEADKIDPGRAVIVQGSSDKRLFAQRAKLVVKRAEPKNLAGKLVLKPIQGNVEAFDAAQEKPASGQAALTGDQLKFDNTAIDEAKGVTVWVQGKSKSAAMGDSGWKVELEALPDKEGDRVTVTVLKAELRIFKSRPEAGGDPQPISDDDKLDKGRYLHKQDADKNHGRAMLVVRKLEPEGLACKMALSPWNITHSPPSEAKAGSPRIKLFDDENAGAEFAFGAEIDHPASGAADDLKKLWVEGATVSDALIDTQIRLDIKDINLGCDRANLTVVEFTKIKATIKSTPALTARPGHPAPADHTYENTKHTEDFADGKNEPLVLMRNAQPDIVLELTAKPDPPVDLDIKWKAVRNKDDEATIGGKDDLPTVTRDGADKRKATLNANARGSFRIRPYIDCNGVDEYSPKEPSIPLNLVLADVEVVSDNSAGFDANLTSTIAGGVVNVRNGTWPGSWAASIAAGGAGMTMELVADVIGGGADGRLGLNKVFGGLVNMLSDNQITLTYTEPAPPNTTYTVRNRYVLNRGDATSNYGGTPMFQPGDPAPNILVFPVLDTGRPSGGLGGESATMSRSGGWDLQTDRPVGRRYTLRCIDSPGRGFLLNHPDHGTARLTDIHYVQAFRANFCFWTNITKVRTQSGDPADRVYSAVRTMDWEAHGDWTVSYAPGATLTNTNPHTIAISNPNTVSPIGRAQDNGVEVRPPSGITTAIAWVTT